MAFWLKDNERCAFGLGWEYHRRGWASHLCPFDPYTQEHHYEWFMDGYMSFKCTEHTLYHDQTV